MNNEQQQRLLEDIQNQIEELQSCLDRAINIRDYIKEQNTDDF